MATTLTTSEIPDVRVVLVDPLARVPFRGTPDSAGLDLSSVEKGEVPPKGSALVRTGLKMAIKTGLYGRVAARSGAAIRHGIQVGAGVIDADYRGEVCVQLLNLGTEPFLYDVGTRIAQLVIERISTQDAVVVGSIDDDTIRGDAGFGSTGGV